MLTVHFWICYILFKKLFKNWWNIWISKILPIQELSRHYHCHHIVHCQDLKSLRKEKLIGSCYEHSWKDKVKYYHKISKSLFCLQQIFSVKNIINTNRTWTQSNFNWGSNNYRWRYSWTVLWFPETYRSRCRRGPRNT